MPFCGGGDISQHIQDAKEQMSDGERYLGWHPGCPYPKSPKPQNSEQYFIHLSEPLDCWPRSSGMKSNMGNTSLNSAPVSELIVLLP